MKARKNQSGIAILEVVLILVIVGIIGFVGFRVFDAKKSADESLRQADATSTVNKPQLDSSAPTVAPVKSTSDLDSAGKTLDSVNPDDGNTDATQLDSQMSGF